MGERGPLRGDANKLSRPGSRSTARIRLDEGSVAVPEPPNADDPRVDAWWEAWATSPQAALFSATDWQRLLMLVPLVARYFASPTPQLMAEIRANETKLGATAADRAHLGWEIAPVIERPESGESSRGRPDPRKGVR